jgi:hypothetical protein
MALANDDDVIKAFPSSRSSKPQGSPRERCQARAHEAKLRIHEEKGVKAAVPAGSRFRGYTSYIVQDLVIRTHVVDTAVSAG